MLNHATDRQRASLNHHSRPQCISSTSFSFSYDGFIEMTSYSVLVDTASVFLYHSVIHNIQLRNTLSTPLLVSCLLFLCKPLQALKLFTLPANSAHAVFRYLCVSNVDHTTLLQTLLSIHYISLLQRSQTCSLQAR